MPRKPACECGECRPCKQRAITHRWRAANPEHLRAYAVAKYAKLKADPDKYAARLAQARESYARCFAEKPAVFRAKARERAMRNPDKVRAKYEKRYSAESVREYRARMSDEVRERARVRGRTYDAIRRGRLIPQPCEVCGAEKVDSHHDDYSKPMEVRWLCHTHHMELHRKDAA